jgi:hypothetical protein
MLIVKWRLSLLIKTSKASCEERSGRPILLPKSEIATPPCRNACLPTGRHFGVQARSPAKAGFTRNETLKVFNAFLVRLCPPLALYPLVEKGLIWVFSE